MFDKWPLCIFLLLASAQSYRMQDPALCVKNFNQFMEKNDDVKSVFLLRCFSMCQLQ